MHLIYILLQWIGFFVAMLIIAYIYDLFTGKLSQKRNYIDEELNQFIKKQKQQNIAKQEGLNNDPLKTKGDKYERHIGKRFEEKGDLVIYNGFIRGVEDGGVDLVAISPEAKIINLIQCKSWHTMTMELKHIENIYLKLQNHDLDFLRLSIDYIQSHLDTKKDLASIREIITSTNQNLDKYTIRKTLYIASEKVVNLEVGQHLTMIKPNIFRYGNMKIVVARI